MKGRFLPAFGVICLIILSWTITLTVLFVRWQDEADPGASTATLVPRGAVLPGRDGAGDGYTNSSEILIGVVVRGPGGDSIDCIAGVADCPVFTSQQPTGTPTATPILSPTLLPVQPSFTPSPTLTPPPTNTPKPDTPATVTPDAYPKCWGRVTAGPLNVRATPGGTPILGTAAEGDILGLESRTASADGRLWYQIYWTPDQIGYVYASLVAIGEGAHCDFGTAWGVWVGPGADRAELLRFGQTLRAAGIQPAATVYGEPETATQLYSDGWIVAYRPWVGDCPDTTIPPEVSARTWWAHIASARGVLWTYLSASNECGWPSMAYLRDWIIELDACAQAAGVDHLIPTVFSSGSPDLDWLPGLYPALERIRDHGGCFGLNQYPVPQALGMSDMALDDLNAWTSYTTYRYMRLVALLPPGLPICVTEAARSGGERPPDWDDITAYVQRVNGSLRFVTLWYDAMPIQPWPAATLRGQLDGLAAAIVRGA